MKTLVCIRCGQKEGAVIPEIPYPGEFGKTIAEKICAPCWDAWKKFSVNVINEFRLKPFLPRDRAIVEQHMRQFLSLETSPGGLPQVPGSSISKEKVVEGLCQVFDPEIPVNIYDLGLIYDVNVQGETVNIKMTLTTPHCPAAQSLPATVKETIGRMTGAKEVVVDVVWDPPWTKDKISEEGRRVLGL